MKAIVVKVFDFAYFCEAVGTRYVRRPVLSMSAQFVCHVIPVG